MPERALHQGVALSLGLFLFAIYLLSYRGGFHSVDEVSTFAVTESLVKFGALNTDQIAWTQWVTTQAEAQGFFGRDGHVYSKKGLAISLAQAPLYWLALILPGLGMLQTVSLLNALLTAGTAVLIYAILHALGFSPRTSLLTALFYGLGTIAWVYAKYLFSGTLAGFLLTLTTYWLLTHRPQYSPWRLALPGFSAGLTVLARANNLLLLALFGLYLLYRLITTRSPSQALNLRRLILQLLPFILGAAAAGGILLWYNGQRSGNPLQTGYDLTIFSPNILLGLYKLLFSPLRGLFIYSPLLLLAIPGWLKLRKTQTGLAWLCLGLVGMTVLLFSAWSSGEGLSWGSRFLVPVIPFLVLPLAPLIEAFPAYPRWIKFVILLLAAASIGIQVLGVAINPWVHLNNLQTQFGGEFFLERTAALTDFSTSQILGQLRNWEVVNSDLVWWQSSHFDWVALAFSLGLVLLTGWLLRRSLAPVAPRQGSLLIGATLLTLGLTYFLLARYYRTDAQFGALDAPYLQALRQAAEASDGPVITVAQYHYHLPMNRFKARVPLLGFAQNAEGLPPTADPLLQDALHTAQTKRQIALITVGRQPADPTNQVEAWLARHTFKATDTWFDETRLVSYGLPGSVERISVEESLGERVELLAQERPLEAQAGQILPIALHWVAQAPLPTDYTVFIQLIDVAGGLAAQRDGPPQGGYTPTGQWPLAGPIIDRHGLSLPAELPPGDYRLIAGLYNPADGARLATSTGADFVDLGLVTIIP